MTKRLIVVLIAISGMALGMPPASARATASVHQRIVWTSAEIVHEHLSARQPTGTASPLTVVYCDLDAHEPYYSKGDVKASATAFCDGLVVQWSDVFAMKYYVAGATHTAKTESSSAKPAGPCEGGYCKNYLLTATTCVHGASYFSSLSATYVLNPGGSPVSASDTTNSVTLC